MKWLLGLFVLPVLLISVSYSQENQQPPPVLEKIYTPFDCVKLALQDLKGVIALNNPDIQPEYIRYLALYNQPKEKRIKYKKSLDFVTNSLNTQYRQIIRTAAIPNDEDPILIRVNLYDYGIDPKAWDDLAEQGSGRVPLPDPYFHARIEVYTPVYRIKKVIVKKWVSGGDGYDYLRDIVEEEKELVPDQKENKRIILASAPWLAHEDLGIAIAELIKLSHTKNPILRADWFACYAAQPPAYYSLIGIKGKFEVVEGVAKIKKGEKEFEALTLVDVNKAKRSAVAAIADSKIVTLNNRILTRFPTVAGYTGGYYWRSSDTKLGIDDQDYLNVITRFDKPKIAAQELIATALNTLQVYAVTDDQENLLLFADPQVAIHGDQMPTRLQDKLIYAGIRNCALCHSEGMIQIEDKVRDLAQGKIALFIDQHSTEEEKKDKNLAKKIQEAFKPDVKNLILHDNAIHTAAILACNGLQPQENRTNLEDLYLEYLDAFITPEVAAREVGLPKDKMLELLKKAVGKLDHTANSLIQDPPVKVSRLIWERQGFTIVSSYLITQKK